MGRRQGAHNVGYEARREALALALVPALLSEGGAASSLRALASAAGVSVPTLVHYFGDRAGAVRAGVAAMGSLGGRYLDQLANEPHGAAEASLRWALGEVVQAWRRFGVGRVIAAGFAAGLHDPGVGPAFITELLEPLLQACERRIATHMAAGELPAGDARAASLALIGPVVLALLHQDALSGASCRPLDVDAFTVGHLAAFLRGWRGVAPGSPAAG